MPSSKSAPSSAMTEPEPTHRGWLAFVPVNMYMPEDDEEDFLFWATAWYWVVPLFFVVMWYRAGMWLATLLNPECEPEWTFRGVHEIDR